MTQRAGKQIKILSYLINRQKHLERNPFIRLMLMSKLFHIRLRRILSQRAQRVSNLGYVNFPIAPVIEKLEGLLKLCKHKMNNQLHV